MSLVKKLDVKNKAKTIGSWEASVAQPRFGYTRFWPIQGVIYRPSLPKDSVRATYGLSYIV